MSQYRKPTHVEMGLRAITSRFVYVLDAIVRFCYDRYDGENVGGVPWLWGFLGDRIDDLRCLWVKRPVKC